MHKYDEQFESTKDAAHHPNLYLGAIAIVINAIFTAAMFAALVTSSAGKGITVAATTIYFTITTPLILLIVSDTLKELIWSMDRERERQHQYRIYRPATDSVQLVEERQPTALPPNYVPAIPDASEATRIAATGWAATLYDAKTGEPDPEMINLKGDKEEPGRIRVAVPKNDEIKQYLLSCNVILKIPHGYRLFLERYPNLSSLARLARSPAPPN